MAPDTLRGERLGEPPAPAEPSIARSEGGLPPEKLVRAFRQSWEFCDIWHRKKKLSSRGEYDEFLVERAVDLGFSDAEIPALLIEHRRLGAESIEIPRDRLASMISKARARNESNEAREQILESSALQGDARPSRSEILKKASAAIRVEVKRIIRFMGEPPSYRLELLEGSIDLGDVDSILSPKRFRSYVAAASHVVIRRFKSYEWAPIAQALLSACEDLDLGPESTTEGIVGEWVEAFLEQTPPVFDRKAAIASRRPHIDKNGVYLFLAELESWVRYHAGERIGRKKLARALRIAGALPHGFATKRGRLKTTAKVWRVLDADAASAYADSMAERGVKVPAFSSDEESGE